MNPARTKTFRVALASSIAVLALGVTLTTACRSPGSGAGLKDAEPRPEERRLDEAAPQAMSAAAAQAAPTDPETVATIGILKMIGANSQFITPPPGGGGTACAGACHGSGPWHSAVGKDQVKKWGKKMQDTQACFDATADFKQKRLCLLANPADANSPYDHAKLGFYRAGVRTSHFRKMFTASFGIVQGRTKWREFANASIMPEKAAEGAQMSNADFEKLRKWVVGGMKKLDEAFGGEVVDPIGGECVDESTDELKAHIEKMKTEGWGWKNVNSEQVSMFGCPERQGEYDELGSPLECFMDDARFPLAHQQAFAKSWAEKHSPTGTAITQRIRIVKELPFQSTFWLRSSADGRFTSSGLRFGVPEGLSTIPGTSDGFIADLKDPARPYIGVTGPYDPGFFPDNKGWTFMTGGDGAYFCSQALLEDPSTKFVDLAAETTYCGKSDMSVYQHVGAMLGGGDYFVVRSDNYANDDGSVGDYLNDPSVEPFAKDNSIMELYPMQESGTKFKIQEAVKIPLVREGDFGISPSAAIITSRIANKVGGGAKQVGYRLRTFDIATKTTKAVGTVCLKGGKATMSFNERVFATHHYTDKDDAKNLRMEPTDPKFTELVSNSANIWVQDLKNPKQKLRLTKMGKGQFALYPHFRADGWLYFLVRDINTQKDYVVASDAAIRMQK